VVKIGLIAPFEGLYRRTGYAALNAMRAAIAEAPYGGMDVLPLALDDFNHPVRAQRAAQMLRIDASVQAVVGPLALTTQASVLGVLEETSLLWLTPLVIDPAGGFADPRTPANWATSLVAVVAEAARDQGSKRLLLAGWPPLPGMPPAPWPEGMGLPVAPGDDPNAVLPTDSVLHLGNPDQAATYLNVLRTLQPAVPYYLGPQGEDPVFAERAQIGGPVFWVTWVDTAYDAWAAQYQPATPASYRTYRATQQALVQLYQAVPYPAPRWEPRLFAVMEDGTSEVFSP
jgi:branched-chain amino acid transport system substrate-binding protein